ncbi:tetratricopeptide repeat protein [Rhodoferax sp.]|uniref:tetratricopeptide repeat protein n=1 Tax=Rhodoferax sp. TaxID=50421 RepID=UPI001EC632D3|nr:tetratricopeptide repeat protein [Rhodoferax sp.]MBT9506181.1 tetratricopeptide repeat protein [Rhodoferax sp.]
MTVPLKQAQILIIDDFQGMRTMLRDIVKAMGVTKIDTANSGKEAISQLRTNKYDIVICDYNLGPGQNGQQVLEESKLLKYIGVSTIWVMVTAEKTVDMVMGAAEVKPDDYLLKPINQSLLESRLEKQIVRKQSLRGIETAINAQDYLAALAECDQQLKAQALNPQEILRIKSDLLMTLGEHDAAKTLFESVLASRSVPWAKTGLGKIHFQTGDYDSAKEIFRQVLEENRMYMEASDWLAKTLNSLGEGDKAQQVLMDAVKLSPNSSVRQRSLGEIAYKNGSLDVAKAAFEKTIKISEFSPHKNPAAYAGLAKVFSAQDSPDEALKVLQRSKKEFKGNPEASIQTAAAESAVYKKMGQMEKAETAMADAEALMSTMSSQISNEASMAMAASLFELGHKEKAFGLLRDIVKNNHESAEILRQVEAVFEGAQLGGEGQAVLNESRQEVININNQGVMLAKKGEFQEGVALLRGAVKDLPNSEVIIMNLCGLLIGLMSKEGPNDLLLREATELLECVRRLNPANKKSQMYASALARLERAK